MIDMEQLGLNFKEPEWAELREAIDAFEGCFTHQIHRDTQQRWIIRKPFVKGVEERYANVMKFENEPYFKKFSGNLPAYKLAMESGAIEILKSEGGKYIEYKACGIKSKIE